MKYKLNDNRIINLKIADFIIQLHFHRTQWRQYEDNFINGIKRLYENFIINDLLTKIDYVIEFFGSRNNAEIIFNKTDDKYYVYLYELHKKNTIITTYQPSLFQFQLIIGNILKQLLLKYHGFLLHASANIIYGKANLFVGSPGAGKSTVMKLLNDRFSSLADDSIIIRKVNDDYYTYQTPFYEKEWWVKKGPKKYALGKIIFLIKSNDFKLERIKDKNIILQRLSKQLWKENDSCNQMKYFLDFLSKFNNYYFLYFSKNKEKLVRLFEEKT